MIHATYTSQTPTDNLDYSLSFAAWIDADDAVTTATVTATPPGLTLTTPVVADNVVTVWVTGGTAGQLYEINYDVTTQAGRVLTRSVSLPVVASI